MSEKEGLLIVFEGSDGSGKLTQARLLQKHIQYLSKYNDVLITHEPWKSSEIKRKLEQDKDAYSDGVRLSELYVDDRVRHTKLLLRPALNAGAVVLADRYMMSTCAYQWAQGVPLHNLLDLHENRGILTPDVTFLLDISSETSYQRVTGRGEQHYVAKIMTPNLLEKFEKNKLFVEKVVNAYQSLGHMAQVDEKIFGEVIIIDASPKEEEVSNTIKNYFNPIYQDWAKRTSHKYDLGIHTKELAESVK